MYFKLFIIQCFYLLNIFTFFVSFFNKYKLPRIIIICNKSLGKLKYIYIANLCCLYNTKHMSCNGLTQKGYICTRKYWIRGCCGKCKDHCCKNYYNNNVLFNKQKNIDDNSLLDEHVITDDNISNPMNYTFEYSSITNQYFSDTSKHNIVIDLTDDVPDKLYVNNKFFSNTPKRNILIDLTDDISENLYINFKKYKYDNNL